MNNINFNLIRFVKSFYKINEIIQNSLILELSFFGKSNTGKSSLINALANKKKIAFTSKKPGSTKLINLFQENNKNLNIFDFPGYGYSKFSNKFKKKYEQNIIKYLKQRAKFLIGIIVLIDIRRTIQYFDKLIINTAIEKQISVLLILNKSDKIKHNLKIKKLDQHIKIIKNLFSNDIQLEVSSLLKENKINKIKNKINKWYLMKN